MWFLFGYCSVCQQTSPSAKKMKLISFSLFSLWNHSLIIVCINTVWAKADSPNSRSYTVFTGKATYHHPGSVRSLKYVQPNVKIQFTLCVCSPVSTYFFIPAKLKPHTALERAILGEACFTFYAKKKKTPIWVWHLHLPALLALARGIQWVSSQLCAAASLEESAPTEGFQRRSKVTRHYNNTARRMFSQLVGEVLFCLTPLKYKPESAEWNSVQQTSFLVVTLDLLKSQLIGHQSEK